MTMALRVLPSFQSFLESARLSPPSPGALAYRHKLHDDYHPAAKMYQLASLTALEYERAMRSPSPESSGSASPTTTDESSDDERVIVRQDQSPRKMANSTPVPHRNKKKYLKEKQRCEIVRRVRAGEKQAHLAKEFGVSRAAVCYLLKHQTEILSRCGDDGFMYTNATSVARAV